MTPFLVDHNLAKILYNSILNKINNSSTVLPSLRKFSPEIIRALTRTPKIISNSYVNTQNHTSNNTFEGNNFKNS